MSVKKRCAGCSMKNCMRPGPSGLAQKSGNNRRKNWRHFPILLALTASPATAAKEVYEEDVEGGRVDTVAGRELRRDHFSQWVVGFNWWLHEQVVIKADYISREYKVEAATKSVLGLSSILFPNFFI